MLQISQLLALVILIGTGYTFLNLRRRKLPYPPGPKSSILLGNAFDIPKHNIGRVFAEWSRKSNSGVVHADAFGRHLIVINSVKVADDLLEKRPELYSDRPNWPTIELLGWQNVSGLLPYGDLWRLHRRILHRNLEGQGATQSRPMIIDEVDSFLRNLLTSNADHLEQHIRLFSMSVTLLMMYGYKPKSLDDPIVRLADQNEKEGFSLLSFGGNLVNLFPFLRHIPPWVPGATIQKKAAELRKIMTTVMDMADSYSKQALADGSARPSLLTDFYSRKEGCGVSLEEEQAVRDATWTVYGAATGTIISTLGSFFYLIAKHPEVQERAQSEIDRLVGKDRLPSYDDRNHLPYIEAIYREVLRAKPPVHTSVYQVNQDDAYMGYCIPRGSTVLGNIWSMTHDETVYADPLSFKPERFFDSDGNLDDDTRILAYGFGRRKCAGKAVASDILWLTMASFLASFKIGPAFDDSGKQMEIDDAYEEYGPIIHKIPFHCSIAPRPSHTGLLVANI
ncbi:cytochrome P450 [Crepidotus variabilis]|uniref:Cytochrome P450 n=1 Tax=Crepidotus variabilis TaxID=179855 RepID=A0A9P6EB12_9AGAR|nr:cytochrome P450 [Crepidotus variabilis]